MPPRSRRRRMPSPKRRHNDARCGLHDVYTFPGAFRARFLTFVPARQPVPGRGRACPVFFGGNFVLRARAGQEGPGECHRPMNLPGILLTLRSYSMVQTPHTLTLNRRVEHRTHASRPPLSFFLASAANPNFTPNATSAATSSSGRCRRHHARLGRLEVGLVAVRILLVVEGLEHGLALPFAHEEHEREDPEASRDSSDEDDNHD